MSSSDGCSLSRALSWVCSRRSQLENAEAENYDDKYRTMKEKPNECRLANATLVLALEANAMALKGPSLAAFPMG